MLPTVVGIQELLQCDRNFCGKNVFGIGIHSSYDKTLSQMKVCGPCKSKVESVNKWKGVGLSLKQTFVECGIGESTTPPSTPVTARVKRMSKGIDSPTTLQARLVKKGRPSSSPKQLRFTNATSVNND